MFILEVNDPDFNFSGYKFTKDDLIIILNTLSSQFGYSGDYYLKGARYDNIDSPITTYKNNRVLIHLTNGSKDDKYQSIYQLSHELFHYLSLVGNNYEDVTLFLDEGLATYSSYLGIKAIYGNDSREVTQVLKYNNDLKGNSDPRNVKYGYAYSLLYPILEEYPECI